MRIRNVSVSEMSDREITDRVESMGGLGLSRPCGRGNVIAANGMGGEETPVLAARGSAAAAPRRDRN
jgi:hypothetical protein